MADAAYGLWPLVVLNTALFIVFAASFFHPKTKRDWRAMGAYSAFLVALFTEMYGTPLTVYSHPAGGDPRRERAMTCHQPARNTIKLPGGGSPRTMEETRFPAVTCGGPVPRLRGMSRPIPPTGRDSRGRRSP
jgi:hypothetical protein